MSTTPTPQDWQEINNAYLAAALRWLRLRLRKLAASSSQPAPAAEPERWNLFGRKPQAEARPGMDDRETTHAYTEMAQWAAAEQPPALLLLRGIFGLSSFESNVLLLCAAIELDPDMAGLCDQVQGIPHPTFSLAMLLFDGQDDDDPEAAPSWDALSPERPLRYWRLIEIIQDRAQPLTTSPLRADERIVSYIKGLNYLDDRLSAFLMPFDTSDEAHLLSFSQQMVAEGIASQILTDGDGRAAPVIQLVGPDLLSKEMVACETLAHFSKVVVTAGAITQLRFTPLRLPITGLPTQANDIETLARLWQRESMLLPIALYLDTHDAPDAASAEGGALNLHRLLARVSGFTLIATREVQAGLGPHTIVVDVNKPSPAEQRAEWDAALNGAAPHAHTRLAAQFNLNLPTIRHIAHAVNGEENEPVSEIPLDQRMWQACLLRIRPRLDKLAHRLEPKAGWDDLVLPAEPLALLHQITDQVRQRLVVYDEWGFRDKMNRGLGISALFAGESGTGKTMAAEVIAQELQLNLYRIDLSAVVSKYIGETEKNLRQVFDAADDGGAALFFDEADALFGKRSEVKDSHDRYANIEIGYLLQRMEAFGGLAILATNMKNSLDPAFWRRLRFVVTFPFPGPAERKLIWQKVFPVGMPPVSLDYDRLARLNLTGGSIHNIALNAAFLAAACQPPQPVTMALLAKAARAEFRKLERPFNEAELCERVTQ